MSKKISRAILINGFAIAGAVVETPESKAMAFYCILTASMLAVDFLRDIMAEEE